MADAPRLRAITPQVSVADLVATCEYYRDVLGFAIDGYWDGTAPFSAPPARPVFAIVSRDDVQVFFSAADLDPVGPGRAGGAYDLFVHVDGVDALASELRARGADVLEGPADRVYGQRELVVRDRNGLVITFASPIVRTGPAGPR